MERAALALEDGTVYVGDAFGASGTVSGKVCFNTSMTGYQEILADPSYRFMLLEVAQRPPRPKSTDPLFHTLVVHPPAFGP